METVYMRNHWFTRLQPHNPQSINYKTNTPKDIPTCNYMA